MSPRCQSLLDALEETTARLAAVRWDDECEAERTLAERSRAIQAIGDWIAHEAAALQLTGPEIFQRLARDLESGKAVLTKLTVEREAGRSRFARLSRERLSLGRLGGAGRAKPRMIDCEG